MQYRRPAFTLIELLVVIAIIGILSTLVMTQLGASQIKARNARAMSDITEIDKAAQSFAVSDPSSGKAIANLSGGYDRITASSSTMADVLTGTENASATPPSYAVSVPTTVGQAYTYTYAVPGTQTGASGRQLVGQPAGLPLYTLCTNLVNSVSGAYFCAQNSGSGSSPAVYASNPTQFGLANGASGILFTPSSGNQQIKIPADPVFNFTGSFTVELWLRPGQYNFIPGTGYHTVINDGNYWSIYVNSGGYIIFRTKGITANYQGNLADGNWHHVAGVYSGQSQIMTIYIDGKPAGSSPPVTFAGTPGDVWIGTTTSDPRTFYDGSTDEARISSIDRYSGPFTPSHYFSTDSNTVALWHMDAGTGTSVSDDSGNGHTGVLSASYGTPPSWGSGVPKE